MQKVVEPWRWVAEDLAHLVPAPAQVVRATARRLGPDIEVRGSSRPFDLRTYLDEIGDQTQVLKMLVGDTQRIWVYAERGFAIPQGVPTDVWRAYDRLRAAGFDRRRIND